MSFNTIPINNRLNINKGWKPQCFNARLGLKYYTRDQVLNLKLYLLLKSFLFYKRYRLLTCIVTIYEGYQKNLVLFLLKIKKWRKMKHRQRYYRGRLALTKHIVTGSTLLRSVNMKKLPLIYCNFFNVKKYVPFKNAMNSHGWNIKNYFLLFLQALTTNTYSKKIKKLYLLYLIQQRQVVFKTNEYLPLISTKKANNYLDLIFLKHLQLQNALINLKYSLFSMFNLYRYATVFYKNNKINVLFSKLIYKRFYFDKKQLLSKQNMIKNFSQILQLELISTLRNKVLNKILLQKKLFLQLKIIKKIIKILHGWYYNKISYQFTIEQMLITKKMHQNTLRNIRLQLRAWYYKNNLNVFRKKKLTRILHTFTSKKNNNISHFNNSTGLANLSKRKLFISQKTLPYYPKKIPTKSRLRHVHKQKFNVLRLKSKLYAWSNHNISRIARRKVKSKILFLIKKIGTKRIVLRKKICKKIFRKKRTIKKENVSYLLNKKNWEEQKLINRRAVVSLKLQKETKNTLKIITNFKLKFLLENYVAQYFNIKPFVTIIHSISEKRKRLPIWRQDKNSFIKIKKISDIFNKENYILFQKKYKQLSVRKIQVKKEAVWLKRRVLALTTRQNNFINKNKKSIIFKRLLPYWVIFASTLDPKPLISQIAYELEKTKKHKMIRYHIKDMIKMLNYKKILGIRIGFYGKFDGSARRRTVIIKTGRLARQQFEKKMNFAQTVANARKGSVGIKMWVTY